jgi:hypothetical protein
MHQSNFEVSALSHSHFSEDAQVPARINWDAFFDVSTIPGRQRNISYIHPVSHIAITFHFNYSWSRVNASQGPSPREDTTQLIFWKSVNSGIENWLLTELKQWEIVADLRRDRTGALTALWPYLVTAMKAPITVISSFRRSTEDWRQGRFTGETFWCYPLNSSASKYPNHPKEHLHQSLLPVLVALYRITIIASLSWLIPDLVAATALSLRSRLRLARQLLYCTSVWIV